jgi:hypothetical protein
MKKIVLILLITSGIVQAQETEFTFNNERGMTDFVVTPAEGKTAPEIYKKIIEWIKVTYKNPDKVILATIENEYVRFEGASDVLYAIHVMGKKYQNSKYQIEISIKDDKYKFDIVGMQAYAAPSQYSAGGWVENGIFNGNLPKENLTLYYNKDGSLKKTFQYLPEVPIYFNNLNKSLYESITTTIKRNEGW